MQAAFVNWFCEEVAKGCTEWSGENKGNPKQKNVIDFCKIM